MVIFFSDRTYEGILILRQAQHYDGNISIPGCDKNMPGCLMAAVRHNRPTIIVYGGTIKPGIRQVDCPSMGTTKGGKVNISDAFESFGLHSETYFHHLSSRSHE